MFTKFPRVFAPLVALLFLQPAFGALKVGDSAPKVLPKQWVQGDEVKEFEGDKVYIIEYWATWCGPCVAAIPHLNDTYKKLKDKGLVVIGQNLGEDEKTASAFVKKMGSKMTYRVTVDDAAGTMAKKWLEAAGQNGIPCAFVVGKSGEIAYIGHPMSLEESLLEKLLAEPSTKASGESTAGSGDKTTTPGAKATELASLAARQIDAGELDKAEGTIAELNDSLSENFRHIGALLQLDLFIAQKDEDSAVQFSKILAEDFAGNTSILNSIAARLVSKPDASAVLQSSAGKIATPLSTAEGDGQCAALATLARIAFLSGDKSRAAGLQNKAVAAASPAESAAAKATLATYQQ
jgi:thiol-disulfide isomerase/thioredoxin